MKDLTNKHKLALEQIWSEASTLLENPVVMLKSDEDSEAYFEHIGAIFEIADKALYPLTKNEMKDLINKMLDGEIDIYQIHTDPEGELQKELSKEIGRLYEAAGEQGYDLDDDCEKIYESILSGMERK